MHPLSFSNPNAFGKEGHDHINISNQSSKQLGLVLDPSYLKVIDYPHIGKFASVVNLWYWLKSSPLDDSLRRATGIRLKAKVMELTPKDKVVNFKAIIAHATYLKLQEYPHCMKELKSLPKDVQLLSYYVPKGTGLRMCSSYASVICEVASTIRYALSKSETPDFTSLADDGDMCDYTYLQSFLVSRFGQDKLVEFSH